MDDRKWFGTLLCTIAACVLSSAAVLGQDSPTSDNRTAGVGVDMPSLSSEMATCDVSCAGCCEENCCQLPEYSCWTAAAEFICFERVAGVHQTLVSTYPPHSPLVPGTGFERLNAADLHQGFAGGTRLGLVRHVDNDSDVEVSFFQIDEWSSVGDIATNYLGPFAPPPNWLTFLAPGDFVQLTNHAAFLGQVGLRCNVQLTERLLLKAGYEALWLGGVALAPAQISRTVSHSVPVTDVYVTTLGIDSTSVAFFHGATVGLEYAF